MSLKVFNATRRWQSDEVDDWRAIGVEFVPSPGPGVNSIPPNADLAYLMREAEAAVAAASAVGAEAVLVSGITGLAIVVAMCAVKAGLRVIEPVTRRRHGDEGEYIVTSYRDLTPAIYEYAPGEAA